VDGLVYMAGGWSLHDRVVATAALVKIDHPFFPGLLAAVFRVMARPASLVYLLCVVTVVFLAWNGSRRFGRRRGRDCPPGPEAA
jgi:hypothetical protein